jgi:hypothetical protein
MGSVFRSHGFGASVVVEANQHGELGRNHRQIADGLDIAAPARDPGYRRDALFSAGAILEALGYKVGLVLSIPGALFEVGLGLLLLVRGFPTMQTRDITRANLAAALTGLPA